MEALRAHARRPLQVGLAQNLAALVPVLETPEHIAAAQKALRQEERGYLTPILEGTYLDSHLKVWNVPAVYITESGCGCDDRLTTDGEVLDTDRVMYLRNHFIAANRAVREGVPLKGYFVWSLLDNFEWKEGYTQRFGLVYVNDQTLKRTPKLSAEFYREVIARNAVV